VSTIDLHAADAYKSEHFVSEISEIVDEVIIAFERCQAEGHEHSDDCLATLQCVEEAKTLARQKIEVQLDRVYRKGVTEATAQERTSEQWVRSVVLLVVVLAVSVMSTVALALQVEPQRFTAYLAPVIGMAGTVIGYWFGSAGRNRERKLAA
jgi:dihydroxyacetone kinase-like predicted kinase